MRNIGVILTVNERFTEPLQLNEGFMSPLRHDRGVSFASRSPCFLCVPIEEFPFRRCSWWLDSTMVISKVEMIKQFLIRQNFQLLELIVDGTLASAQANTQSNHFGLTFQLNFKGFASAVTIDRRLGGLSRGRSPQVVSTAANSSWLCVRSH